MLYFEDFNVGDVRKSVESYSLTKEEIMEVGNRWDPQSFHTDEEAAKDSMFGGLVASSVHLFAVMTWFSHHLGEDPVAAVTALGFNDLQWHHPVYAGDDLSLITECIVARPSNSRPDCGVLQSANELINQDGKKVFSMKVSLLIKKRPT